jgi:hypothetical protein
MAAISASGVPDHTGHPPPGSSKRRRLSPGPGQYRMLLCRRPGLEPCGPRAGDGRHADRPDPGCSSTGGGRSHGIWSTEGRFRCGLLAGEESLVSGIRSGHLPR